MTTLVALSTCDALVMGCDSLGTFQRRLVDLRDIVENFFDSELNVKVENGKPLLDYSELYRVSQLIPYSHMTHVDKLFSLEPLPMGVMFAGEASIGARSIKNLIGEFKSSVIKRKSPPLRKTVGNVAKELLSFLWGIYSQVHTDENDRPELEGILGGYDSSKFIPCVARIYVHENRMQKADYDPGVYFGAQTKEIQRIVFGTDVENKINLNERLQKVLEDYYDIITTELKNVAVSIQIKEPKEVGLDLFKNWDITRLAANISAFSDQNAIECVDFLVNIMIKSQQFSSEMPTVGGAVQLGIIKKNSGFTWISKRVWQHGDFNVPIKE